MPTLANVLGSLTMQQVDDVVATLDKEGSMSLEELIRGIKRQVSRLEAEDLSPHKKVELLLAIRNDIRETIPNVLSPFTLRQWEDMAIGEFSHIESPVQITPEVEKLIDKTNGGTEDTEVSMPFPGVKELDTKKARILAKLKGDIQLNTMDGKADIAVIEALAPHTGVLGLSLDIVDMEMATAIGKHEGSIDLTANIGLEELKVIVGDKVRKSLSFIGLKKVDKEMAEVMIRGCSDEIWISAYSIDLAAVCVLSQFPGKHLHPGLTDMSVEFAEALAEFKGETMNLEDTEELLSEDAAKALTGFKGEIEIDRENKALIESFKQG